MAVSPARPEYGPGELGLGAQGERFIARLAEPGFIESVDVPVLTLAARKDALVSWPAIARTAARLPRGELVDFGRGAAHELLREADPVREHVLAQIDCFLDRVVPRPRVA